MPWNTDAGWHAKYVANDVGSIYDNLELGPWNADGTLRDPKWAEGLNPTIPNAGLKKNREWPQSVANSPASTGVGTFGAGASRKVKVAKCPISFTGQKFGSNNFQTLYFSNAPAQHCINIQKCDTRCVNKALPNHEKDCHVSNAEVNGYASAFSNPDKCFLGVDKQHPVSFNLSCWSVGADYENKVDLDHVTKVPSGTDCPPGQRAWKNLVPGFWFCDAWDGTSKPDSNYNAAPTVSVFDINKGKVGHCLENIAWGTRCQLCETKAPSGWTWLAGRQCSILPPFYTEGTVCTCSGDSPAVTTTAPQQVPALLEVRIPTHIV
jgi:hypothetical protein